ncbi:MULTISPECIES: 3-deoxy-7-phosphoheptulonate synthase [unclassified Streptomyces]|uniref:3-deoxy-7-phosphoheptulonate synthase n=1 Tax=unclassified Streptomyces TaxID=2593676 RepID=UPI00073BF790|nr:3-deoxy-7-phosphoheptulonate synthase class II [Streptomyces sp. AVP053U2]ODA74944.1 Phospho-2-dehydro-3-deoxyheptonate aldolase [Streptomyces sp. AVP053U2]
MNPNHTAAATGPFAAQQPDWPDPDALRSVADELATLPALVAAEECDRLRERLAAVARGEALLLQGGDCAESLAEVGPDTTTAKYRTLTLMAAVISEAAELPVVRLGRIAGQFAKPRSNPTELHEGIELPSYRGDMVNSPAFTAAARTPDPNRLRRVYDASAETLGHLSELTAADGGEFWTSHEALVLEYERALCRTTAAGRYASSGHLLWIGERTRQPDCAHVDFAARVRNPIAVKLGPSSTPDDTLRLIDRLDPDREPGRLTFISRMGAGTVRDTLPDLVAKVAASGAEVAWICDPVHGNTVSSPTGHKTRRLDDVLNEIKGFLEVHRSLGTHPGGFHLELTGNHVTECVGGTYEVRFEDLPNRYETVCDPRLNLGQSLDVAFELAAMYTASPVADRGTTWAAA